ncbi:MAG: hypothetical protein OEV99_17565 [Nitrospira sp.]|nr:hypothetical protein [Nitrospira sp.]
MAALTLVFVLAVLLEHAFSTLFNWRVFLTYFSRTGVKTIIMVVASWLVVREFGVDIVAELVTVYRTNPQPSGWLSQFLTALILASGSTGVFNLMRALGYRTESRETEHNVKPPVDQAWIAIYVKRAKSVGDIRVTIKEVGSASSHPSAPSPIAGTIRSTRPPLLSLIFRGSNRFPQNGGYVLKPHVIYEISVIGKDAEGVKLEALQEQAYVFAPRAVVDFSASL